MVDSDHNNVDGSEGEGPGLDVVFFKVETADILHDLHIVVNDQTFHTLGQ